MGKTNGQKALISLAALRPKKPQLPSLRSSSASEGYYYRPEMAQQSIAQLAADQPFWSQVFASQRHGAAFSARLTAIFPAGWKADDNQRQQLDKALQRLGSGDYQQLYWQTAARRSAYFLQFLNSPPPGASPLYMNRLLDFFHQATAELDSYQQLSPEQRSTRDKDNYRELTERLAALAARIKELAADPDGDQQQLAGLQSGQYFYQGLQATFSHFAANNLDSDPAGDLNCFSAGMSAVVDDSHLSGELDRWRRAELQALIVAWQSPFWHKDSASPSSW